MSDRRRCWMAADRLPHTTHGDCPGYLPHMAEGLQRIMDHQADRRPDGADQAERQVWERRIGGTDVAEHRLHLEVDEQGRARVHEAVLAQLLVDAGWERTS